MSNFLLLLGVSGVGKSTIVEELIRLDQRFSYISPYTTRTLRDGEKNKISINDKEMDLMWNRGQLLVINTLYGIRYATPRQPIVQALENQRFPLLDWPVSKKQIMTEAFPNQLYSVYISPPSIEVLRERLLKDGRDVNGSRLKAARDELEAFWSRRYDGLYDLAVTSEDEKISDVAELIYVNYLSSF